MGPRNEQKLRIEKLEGAEIVPAPNLEGVPRLNKRHPDMEVRVAAVKARGQRRRPDVTRWIDDQGSLVEQDSTNGTKTLTRQCRECERWFRMVRGTRGRARWPLTCSEECKVANRRKVDAERKRAQRERDKLPVRYMFETIDCDLYCDRLEDYLRRGNNVVEVGDGYVVQRLSPEARAAAEAYLEAQEEWESWARG